MNYKININPSEKYLFQIEKWLVDEDNESGKGFYCNWDIILSAFEKGRLIILIENELAIGFLIFRKNDLILEIDIAEIKPSERKKGLGKKLIEEVLLEFSKNGVFVAELFCSPTNSESFWKQLGFLNFPEFPHNKSKIRMYKPLIGTLDTCDSNHSDEVIELWDSEPHIAANIEPKWVWEPIFKSNSRRLIHPIVHPAHYDWQIRWRKGDKVHQVNKIKRFNVEEIEFGDFIIIEQLSMHTI